MLQTRSFRHIQGPRNASAGGVGLREGRVHWNLHSHVAHGSEEATEVTADGIYSASQFVGR